MTLTLRSASTTTGTTKGSALTHAEMDANWLHALQSANTEFLQSGSGASARTVQRKLSDVVSVFDFIPASEHDAIIARTSSTDVSSYIQLALDTGRHVFMPGGLFNIGAGLTMSVAGQQLIGSGMGNEAAAKSTRIKATAAINMLLVSSARCFISGMYLDGNSVATNGLVLHQANTGLVQQVNVQNCTQDGFLFDTAATTPTGSNNTLQLIGCISNANNRGFAAPTPQGDNGGIQLIGCWAGSNTSHGMLLKGSSWRVMGGISEGNGGYGIQISESTDSSITTGCMIMYTWLENNTLGGVRGGGQSVRNVYWRSPVSEMQSLSLAAGSEDLQVSTNNDGGAYFEVTDGTSTVFLKPNGRQVSVAQVVFPATQSASADPNTLDDYEEGTWTPVLTFATPGDLSVVYSSQVGTYTKIGRVVTLNFNVDTSTFTHTTASGALQITGTPFTSSNALHFYGSGIWQGITKANYTDLSFNINASSSVVGAILSGSGQTVATVSTGDMPSGGTVRLRGTVVYHV